MTQSKIVDRFIECLTHAEKTKEVGPLAKLFAKNARLCNLTKKFSHQQSHGRPGFAALATKDMAPFAGSAHEHPVTPESFWWQYVRAFDEINSKFEKITDNGNYAVLEWVSHGVLPMGVPIHYAGVSILEYEGEEIHEFRTYYDSAAFSPHTSHSLNPHSATPSLLDMSPQVSS
jgi:hypothetical protein